MINVVTIDDHSVVRAGISEMISSRSDDIRVVCNTCHCHKDGPACLKEMVSCDGVKIDVALVDISVKNNPMWGLGVIRETALSNKKARLIALTMFSEESLAPAVKSAGASGFLTKDSSPEEILTAIRHVYSGGEYFTPNAIDAIERASCPPKALPHETLSPREFQCLMMLVGGLKTSEISKILGISIKTANIYRANIMDKLSARTVADITRYAITHKLVT